jgi:hypothetical protein
MGMNSGKTAIAIPDEVDGAHGAVVKPFRTL